jgi:hypothetical protein
MAAPERLADLDDRASLLQSDGSYVEPPANAEARLDAQQLLTSRAAP